MTVPIDPRAQAQAAKQARQMARMQPAQTNIPLPAPGVPPPAAAPPPGGAQPPPPAAPPPAAAPPPPAAAPPPAARANRQGGVGGPLGYQGATAFAAQQQDPGTAYEQRVLGGEFLDPGQNPYLQKYTDQLGDQFQRQLGRSLSQVSSPFLSGATLGATGIHGSARAQHGAEALGDFQTGINKIYVDEYGRERGFQQDTSQDIGQRTMNLRDQASRNYGTDVQARTQIQSAKIAAQSALQQARMAQALGYDQLAADSMFKYEQLNQNATAMEQDWLIRSGGMQADIMRGFSETNQYGQPVSQGDAITQGIFGGGAMGAGAYDAFGPGYGGGGGLNNNPAGRYFEQGGWGRR